MKNEETKKVANVEAAKVAVETEKELTVSERVSAYLANHAVEHYCDALGLDVDKVQATVDAVKKEDGLYWVFTAPVIGGTRPDGKPNPTREEWEAMNKGAIRCDVLDSKQWYKKAISIDDANSVRRILSSLGNYRDAKEKGRARLIATLKAELTEAFLADDMEKATKLRAQIKDLEK